MARKFKTVDYERSGQQTLTIDECLPSDHLARFMKSSGWKPRRLRRGGKPVRRRRIQRLADLYG